MNGGTFVLHSASFQYKKWLLPKNMFVFFYLSNYYYFQTNWTKFIIPLQMYSFTHRLINFLLLVHTQRFCFSRLNRTILCWEAGMFQWFHWSTAWNWLYHQLLYKRGLKEHTLDRKELFQRICGLNATHHSFDQKTELSS